MKTDYLIVGQGLAGSLLAWELIQRGCHIIIVDNGKENASKVAAGIINPITGMRFVISPDIATLLPVAQASYAELAIYFGQKFYLEMPMLRLFQDKAELDACKRRKQQASYLPYLGELSLSGQQLAGFSTPFGFIEQHQTGHLLTRPFLAYLRQFFVENNCYRQIDLAYQDLQLDTGVTWGGINAKQVIFCEGYQVSANPWFAWLPLQPAKGETLTLLAQEALLSENIINYGNWLLPISPGKIRMGATFERDNLDLTPSEQAKQGLLEGLGIYSTSLSKARVIDHEAGIRPCTVDKSPMLGLHPHNDRLAIFNGFGAKGALQIPWYCKRFADFLLNNLPLPKSCEINRFQSRYFIG